MDHRHECLAYVVAFHFISSHHVYVHVGIRLTDCGLAQFCTNPAEFAFTVADVLTATPRVSFMPTLVSTMHDAAGV